MTKSIPKLEDLFKLYTVQEYIDAGLAEPPKFLIEELIPQDRLGMLVGAQKTNKTTLAYEIARCIADENVNECLGHKVLEHGHVFYLSLEGGFSSQIRSFGQPSTNENLTLFENKHFTLDNKKNLEVLKDFIKRNNTKLFIVDCIYKFMDGNYANASEIKPVLINLETISRELNVTVLMLHHTGRATGKIEQDLNDIAGSFNIVRSCEFTLFLSAVPKTEEEEEKEANMTKEELLLLPKKRILKKLDYRDGGEGFDKYSIDIYFREDQKGYMDSRRYKSTKKKESPKSRLEDLVNYSLELIKEMPVINGTTLSEKLHEVYPDLTVKTIKDKYATKIIEALKTKGKIEKVKGKGYNYQYIDYNQIPF
ncbi:AAA family ATPase [Methanobrevibacter sp.]|uniref:AAA family ATPase n=1 Tax=Methanobrevibacter sp. TaxID=66852 RepID=UPI0026E0D9D8|nr:AAA family ATPase [Methanobrevibacter sp.]MDO5861150.1 AAA family ATPase [Methanobrevibacter sp.]